MIRRSKDVFYYVGQEIPLHGMDRYRCLDATTKSFLQTARFRIGLIIFALACCFCLIIGRLFYLTIVNYHSRSFKPSVLRTEFVMQRQNILDRNGLVIALNIPTEDLSANPQKIKNPEETARQLVQALPDLKYDEVYEKLTGKGNFKYIKRNITPTEQKAIRWIGNPYLMETENEKRVYPQGNLFAHILGTVDIDNVGTSGLEKAYDEELKHSDLQLSLDTTIQGILRQVLKEHIQKYQAIGGLGIVMNVKNGEVLAMVSLPDYDPNRPADSKQEDRFNKATVGTYEFGSVFKLFNTAMGLENKDIRPTDSLDATKNSLKINWARGKKTIEDFNGGEDRYLTIPEVLIHSSNIGSARIALKAGWQKQKEFLGRFGFYERLPIVLTERGWTRYPREDKWADITSANVAYGYGIQVTPLHLIAAVSALVNGGYYHVPTFLKNGNKGKPEIQVLFNPAVSEQIRRMMWAVINWDMKETHPVYGYAVGGKTGTANMIDANGKYDKKRNRTSFIGVFPMTDPQYAILITIEDPKKIKENWYFNNAGWTAKPTGLAVIAQIAPYLGIMPEPRWEQPAYIENAIRNSKEHQKR